jgi:hypothetical protein
MTAWNELTTDQQNAYLAFQRTLRATAAEQAKVNNHWDAVNDAYSQIQALGLDTGEEPPNSSGLAGSLALTHGELVSIVAHGQGILTNYNTAGHRQLWAKAAGVDNLIG